MAIGLGGDVTADELASQFSCQCLAGGLVQVGDHDLGAGLGQHAGGACTQA
ncbi:hypothetical protein D9M72_607000 [compost metagenome]